MIALGLLMAQPLAQAASAEPPAQVAPEQQDSALGDADSGRLKTFRPVPFTASARE